MKKTYRIRCGAYDDYLTLVMEHNIQFTEDEFKKICEDTIVDIAIFRDITVTDRYNSNSIFDHLSKESRFDENLFLKLMERKGFTTLTFDVDLGICGSSRAFDRYNKNALVERIEKHTTPNLGDGEHFLSNSNYRDIKLKDAQDFTEIETIISRLSHYEKFTLYDASMVLSWQIGYLNYPKLKEVTIDLINQLLTMNLIHLIDEDEFEWNRGK